MSLTQYLSVAHNAREAIHVSASSERQE